jgi:DNA-binding winged helix-turn-helix (wHTH) protein
VPCYRFGPYIVSPRRRLLVRDGRELPLIPRYFDLLVFLIAHRQEAVHRRDIFDKVWTDVIVSDSALSQAIRTIRRTLGDDSREPRFIRTVSRHGYRFVYSEVLEADDDAPELDAATSEPPARVSSEPPEPPFEALLQRLASEQAELEDRTEAAELLHGLGTAQALERLGTRQGHAFARALLRDTRWETAGAGPVPILGQPAPAATAWALVRLRLRRAAKITAARSAGGAAGASVAGAAAGLVGGAVLAVAPGGTATGAVIPVLAALGAFCGAIGGAGVGGGLSVAEAIARSRRAIALVPGAAMGGLAAGAIAEWLGTWTLAAVVGVDVNVGGSIEGIAIGAAGGLGYGAATRAAEGGLAAPRGRDRFRVALLTAAGCAVAGFVLSLAGRPLVGGTIHLIAQASQGSQVALTPLARLLGEPDLGPVSAALLNTGEAALFGLGFALGLTKRP